MAEAELEPWTSHTPYIRTKQHHLHLEFSPLDISKDLGNANPSLSLELHQLPTATVKIRKILYWYENDLFLVL